MARASPRWHTFLSKLFERSARPSDVDGTTPQAVADDTDRALLATLGHQVVVAVRSAQLLGQADGLRAEADVIRQELAAVRAREMVEREREHLARDLHDTVAQQVLAIGMKLEWCRRTVGDGELSASLVEARDLARTTVEHLRSTIAALTTESDPDAGDLAVRLRGVVGAAGGRGPGVFLECPVVLPPMPASTSRAVEMVAREAIANAVVHGEAGRVAVDVAITGGSLVLRVSDDGTGRPEALRGQLREALVRRESGYNRGLANLYLRVREVGGTLKILGSPIPGGRGVTVRAIVPLDADLV